MHSFITLRKIFTVFILSAGFLSACTRISSSDVGSGLIPPIDGITTLDTLLEVITETFDSPDTARIYRSDMHVLGAITNDPLFGTTRASMFFEMKPEYYPFYIPGHKDSVVVDSAVLILSYAGLYGDSTQPLRLTVSEINQNTPLDPQRLYPVDYPNVQPVLPGFQMGPSVNVDIRRLTDSVNNRYENAKNQIRIKLNKSVADRFIKLYDSSGAYKNDSTFRTFFPGFAVTVDAASPANALLQINLTDTNSKFALYYSSSSTGASQRDTTVSYFRFYPTVSGDANFVTRNRSGAEISSHLSTSTSLKPDSLLYIQTTPGTYARITVPGLAGLSNRFIHRAELIAEQVPDDGHLILEQQLTPPRYLLLTIYDSVNKQKRNVPNDYAMSSSGPNIADFGGYITSKSVPGYDKIAAYTFNISRYVQGIVTRKDPAFTFLLSAPANDSILYTTPYPITAPLDTAYLSSAVGNITGDGRVRLGGGTHSRFRMRLRIIYSRL
jgi:hypothetical protein